MTNWGQLIRDLRIEQGRSQRELASSAGLSRTVIRQIEAAEAGSTKITSIEAIVKALGYDLEAVRVAKAGSDEALAMIEGPKPKPRPKSELEQEPSIDPIERWRLERLASHRARYGD